MEFYLRIKTLPPAVRLEILKKMATFLSNKELRTVMDRISAGEDPLWVHQKLGLFDQYRVETARIILEAENSL